ncbi:hypothetical protein K435DRAFT_824518 [Dendrothele bispora CBS 962.96]|uniref:DUF6570 domain-containing protein n=1 Tax=Dendrothele bispora (strain CBS 962.96) TaxID=1314807 RepID=A0A4V4HAU4_DENBC|nr:hypothetical protein K435DRAFT_824518 [Dendrothele bispora CBS 962.96]
MIARCRAKCWIIQLKEEDRASDPITQRGVKGHIIIYPQQPSAVAKLLPPSIEEISSPICVLFIGSQPPSQEWLRTKAKPLTVRPTVVRRALCWLRAHNKLYKDVEINDRVLSSLPDNYVLPVHVEHVPTNDTLDTLTSRYDSISAPEQPTASSTQTPPEIPFESVVVTDVDGNASANELRAAAMRHVTKKGGAYVQVAHDAVPANEFYNPDLFPMLYPTLFPYGLGGFENSLRSSAISFKRHVKHLALFIPIHGIQHFPAEGDTAPNEHESQTFQL